MKQIINRSTIERLLRKLTPENAFTILSELENVIDYEGKNPLIIALEEKMYNSFLIMISPTKYPNPKSGETYRIFYDPFNTAIFESIDGLNWSIDDSVYPLQDGDYTNIDKTKVTFYSPYSAFNYICHLKEDEQRQSLIDACHLVDEDIIDQMAMKDIPPKDKRNNIKLYIEEDYIRYVPYPLRNVLHTLIEKNIPVTKWGIEKNHIFSV